MKESDIRSREAHNRYLELVALDAEGLAARTGVFHQVDCPCCGTRRSSHEFEKSGFSYVTCGECDTLYVNPRPTFDALTEIYTESESTRYWVNEFFLPMVEPRRDKIFRPRAQHFVTRFRTSDVVRVGDIGAGFGLFLEELRKVWPHAELTAIEPSAEMAAICRSKGLAVLEAMMEDVRSDVEQFDILTSFELFEHLHDPFLFLRQARRLLKADGRLYLTTLNGLGFDIQVFWENAKAVSPPHHLNFANPQSIRRLFERAGYEGEEIATPGELDWDIVEGAYHVERRDPGRFFRTVSKYGTAESKRALQSWIRDCGFSSHMRVIARRLDA